MKLRTKLLALTAALAVSAAATAQIWGPVVGGFINGGVVYGAGGIAAQDSTKFFWDGTNHRLGIGNAVPSVPLDVTGNVAISGATAITGATTLGGGVTGNVTATGGVSGTTGAFSSTLTSGDVATFSVGVRGTTTNDNAATGRIGEHVVSYAPVVGAAATTLISDITTISLTAGDWNCSAVFYIISMTAANTTIIAVGISAGTAGNTFSDASPGDNQVIVSGAPIGLTQTSLTVPEWRVSLAGTTTVRAKAQLVYSAGTPSVYTRLSCRRAR